MENLNSRDRTGGGWLSVLRTGDRGAALGWGGSPRQGRGGKITDSLKHPRGCTMVEGNLNRGAGHKGGEGGRGLHRGAPESPPPVLPSC